jgi:hypothetical protein
LLVVLLPSALLELFPLPFSYYHSFSYPLLSDQSFPHGMLLSLLKYLHVPFSLLLLLLLHLLLLPLLLLLFLLLL